MIVLMGRWEPDARGRLIVAALELYAERGYDDTTVADIAARAGVTERTFFRHFADKREVLFDGAGQLQERVLAAIAAAPADASPFDIMGDAMRRAGEHLDELGEFARRRAAVVASTPSLQERELLKLAALSAASAGALRARGVREPIASLAAELGGAAFKVGFETWTHDEARPPAPLPEHIDAALAELRAVTS
jgi:AcrR family transcriptional regulator